MRGAMCPFDCPFFLARLLWTRTASSRASSSDAGTPVVAGADAGASSTAVMMNSLGFAGRPSYGRPFVLACAEDGQRRSIHPETDFLSEPGGGRRAGAG